MSHISEKHPFVSRVKNNRTVWAVYLATNLLPDIEFTVTLLL